MPTPKEAGSWGFNSPTQQQLGPSKYTDILPASGRHTPFLLQAWLYTGWAVNVAEWQPRAYLAQTLRKHEYAIITQALGMAAFQAVKS